MVRRGKMFTDVKNTNFAFDTGCPDESHLILTNTFSLIVEKIVPHKRENSEMKPCSLLIRRI